MAINLAKKYSPDIVKKWTAESYIAGKVNNVYDFAGVRSITVYTPTTVALSDYSRTASSSRFGTPVEMADTLQEMALAMDKSFSITIDKGSNSDQMNIKGAGEMMSLQIKEQMVPFLDKYALLKFAQYSGSKVAVTAPSVSNIVASLSSGLTQFDNDMVPDDNRFIYIGATNYDLLRRSTEIFNTPSLSAQTIGRGVVGQFMNATLVKMPDSYLPIGVAFIIVHKDAVLFPMKLKTLRILTDVAGIDGAVLEGRQYFDAFVLAQKAVGVYVGHVSATLAKYATPTSAYAGSGQSVTLTNASIPTGSTIYYTTDGSDPRFSSTSGGPNTGFMGNVKVSSALALGTLTDLAVGYPVKAVFRFPTDWTTANQTKPTDFALCSDVFTSAVRTS